MKANEFKKLIKPIIKQTIKEVLLEEGVLSNIVSEVAIGLQNQRVVTEGVTVTKNTEDLEAKAERLERQRQEKIKKLNESSKLGGVFTGTAPLVESSGQGPLAGTSPTDAGVDITAIQQIANGKWKHLIK
tara:strand:- start:245 stop:634 length:390 start_codon:yes stop_codon:yes gene_type:complete